MASDNTRELPRDEWRPFADRLRRAVDATGETAMAIAERGGTNSGNLSKLMSAKRGPPTGAKLTQLARVLNVRIEWLVNGDEPMRPGGDAASATASTVTVEPIAVRELRPIFRDYDWPPNTPTETITEIWNAIQAEAFKGGDAPINPKHWTRRIAEEFAARKGKRIAHVDTSDPVEERKRARKRT